MEFNVENISPTKRKIELMLTTGEVNAALDKTIAQYQKNLSLPGFRKGKVPNQVVERKFFEEIVDKATKEKLNECLAEVLAKSGLKPLFNVTTDETYFKRGEAFSCNLSFEVLPTISFPVYEGLSIEEEEPLVTDSDVDLIVQNIQEALAEWEEVTDGRLPQDGDTVDVNYSGSENGVLVESVQGTNFVVTLGRKQALADFEALVKTIPVGEEREGVVHFPENYGNRDLAGKDILFKVFLNILKAPVLPKLDDAFAQKAGYEDLVILKKEAREYLLKSQEQQVKARAMKKVLDNLLSQVVVEVPETMLDTKIERILGDQTVRSKNSKEESKADLKQNTDDERYSKAKEEALMLLQPQVFLMAIAAKEGLVIVEKEIEAALHRMAIEARQDPKIFRDAYYRTGLVYELRDHLLADKAMDFIYEKGEITKVAQEA